MNICFYLSTLTYGGIGRVVSLVGNALVRQSEHHITALCHSNHGDPDVYSTDFPVTYLYEKRIPVSTAMIKDHYVKKVSDYLKENAIDLLIVCDELFFPAAVIAGRKIRVLCWLHTSPYVNTDYRFQRSGRWFGFKRCDGIVTITEKTKRILQPKYRRKKIICIYNPADEALFSVDRAYDPDTMKIIAVGRLTYQKNFQSLIRIAKVIKSKLPGLQWHIYGEGDDRPELESLIMQDQLEDTVILKGQCADLYERYNDYSAVVMTSRYEGFPMTLIEAAACGIPMLSYDIFTGPSEIIVEGENGFLCREGDEDEMAQRILTLFSDAELRSKMSDNCRKTALQFGLDRITAQWLDAIKDFCR